MILKNKDIPDATVLKLVAKQLRNNQTAKGFKMKTKKGVRTLTFEEVVEFIDTLASQLESGQYGEIRRCDTCGNFRRSGQKGRRGWCTPTTHTCYKSPTEYCSGWVPMSPEQIRLKEKLNEHFRTQTK